MPGLPRYPQISVANRGRFLLIRRGFAKGIPAAAGTSRADQVEASLQAVNRNVDNKQDPPKPDTSKAKYLDPHPHPEELWTPEELEGGRRLLHRLQLARERQANERRLMSPASKATTLRRIQ